MANKIKNKSVVTPYQPSITEWFADIGEIKDANAFRKEDNFKADRLEKLFQTIGLPYERPRAFPARDLTERRPVFKKILEKRANELCAIRLVPKKQGLPKLRNRGLSIQECYETWYLKQKINPDDYIAYLCPHSDKLLWSTIFVVNNQLIFGEIIKGLHSQLTHGDTMHTLYQFRFDFKKWRWSARNDEADLIIKKIVKLLSVTQANKRIFLQKTLRAKFSHNYLTGYFEANIWPNNQPYFIDYNRLLPKYIPAPPPLSDRRKKIKPQLLTGVSAFPGVITGQVHVISPDKIKATVFRPGSILACDNTDVRYLPLIKKAGAIVTNRGGILCHAAIMARELKIPCIVDTKKATSKVKNGETITVDADQGIVLKM